MFGTLLESRRSRQWRLAGTVASVVVHTTVIAVAVVTGASATMRVTATDVTPRPDLVWVSPRRWLPPLAPEGPHLSVDRWPELSTRRIVYADRQFDAPMVQERDLVGDLTSETHPTRCLGHCRENWQADPNAFAGAPATIATVDRAAFLVAPPRPRYPERLRTAGVTGRVVVRFVVDTLGRVEPASIVIRESSHDLFIEAVRATLPALAFVPAEAGGRKVRMLVDLPFEFRLHD
jgi:periplasmic protein TonB